MCVLSISVSSDFRLCLAVQAAVHALFAVGQRKDLRKLLLHGGNAARVFAADDVCNALGKLQLPLFNLLAVFDEIHGDAGVDVADDVPVEIENPVDFDDVLAPELAAGT